MKVNNIYFTYINIVTKKIFHFSFYYISHLFIDVLFQERKNNTFYILHVYQFPKIYHFLANLIPFISIISINSFSIACLYHFMLKNTSLLYVFYMLITIQFSQFIYFYTIVSIVKTKNLLKMKIISLFVFLINLLFSKATEFSYFYILFPPFLIKILNNYFFDSLFYYSQIDQIYITEITIFFISWNIILIIFLKFIIKIKVCGKEEKKLNFEQDLILMNVDILHDKNKYKSKEIKIKRNKINLITGDNHSGKSNILKQICNNIPNGKIFYLLTKGKGFLYNLKFNENIKFFKMLLNFNNNRINNYLIKNKEQLLINNEENSFENESFFSKLNDPLQRDDNRRNNIQLFKLDLLINLLNESAIEKEFIILDQPFNKLNKKEIHDYLVYLKFFDHNIIITSNYKPYNTDINIIFQSKNIYYFTDQIKSENNKNLVDQVISHDVTELYLYIDNKKSNKSININRNKLQKNPIETIKIKSKMFQFLKHISIFVFIFICSCISLKFNSVNIEDFDMINHNQQLDLDKLKTKRINEPLDKIFISDKFNRNSDLYICMKQSINFLNSTENAKYLEEYFNKSTIFNEHAILLDLEL